MNTSFQHFTFTLLTGGTIKVQLRAKQTAHLVNKHYQNEVTLTGQNPTLKCYQPLEILTYFENTGYMGSVGKRAVKLPYVKL